MANGSAQALGEQLQTELTPVSWRVLRLWDIGPRGPGVANPQCHPPYPQSPVPEGAG